MSDKALDISLCVLFGIVFMLHVLAAIIGLANGNPYALALAIPALVWGALFRFKVATATSKRE